MSFPNTLDTTSTIPVETAGTTLSTNHVENHTATQGAIIAIETLLGVVGSAVSGTFNYILGEITGTDKAVGKSATQTLTNKTLTSPTITGGTLTTSTVNGVTLQTGGSATDFLAANGSYVAGSVTNASTTVKGIIELATASEITAGTATGGTGAALVVTPDALANSTPVFNGSGLTNISGFLTSGAPGTTTNNTTATVLTYSLPGGILSTNKGVRMRFATSVNNTGSNSTCSYTVQYGGSTIGSWTAVAVSGTPSWIIQTVAEITLFGSGATGSQHATGIYGAQVTAGSATAFGQYFPGSASQNTTAVDSTVAQNITVSCTSNSTAHTGTFVDYFIQKIV